MDDKQFEELTRRMDVLIGLAAMSATSGKNLTERILVLSAVGLKPSEIALILGKPANQVRTLLSRGRKRGEGGSTG